MVRDTGSRTNKISFMSGLNSKIRFGIFMPPTSKKLRGHIGLGLSVQSVSLLVSQSVSLSVCLSVMREHSVRNR